MNAYLQFIPILTALIFAALYPLFFWCTHPDPIVLGFRQFNLGLACFVGGLGVVGLFFLAGVDSAILWMASGWLLSLFIVSALSWKRASLPLSWVSLPAVAGILLVGNTHVLFSGLSASTVWASVVSGGVLCGVIFATVLGHWYLNVPGLAMAPLVRCVRVFYFFVLVRAMLDVVVLSFSRVPFEGDVISSFALMQHLEGLFLWVALFFGLLLPLFTTPLVFGTLRVKSTQSATGILYAILLSVFMGDLAARFGLLAYQLAL